MSKVVPLIIFGVTITVCGVYWALWDGSREYLDSILVEDAYYTLMYFGFRVLPIILIFIGIMSLIAAGVSKSRERSVEY